MSTYYYLPTRNVFGENSVEEVGELMRSLNGSRVMIVTDDFLSKSPMAARIQGILERSGVQSHVFAGTEPNPKVTNVEAGLRFYQEHGCDSIISLGGGSSHDCAKATKQQIIDIYQQAYDGTLSQ